MLLALTGLLSPANAADERYTYPQQFSMSPKGVNVQTGRFMHKQMDLSVGPLKVLRSWGDAAVYIGVSPQLGGLKLYPQGSAVGWVHTYMAGITSYNADNMTHYRVTVDDVQYKFKTLADGNLVPANSTSQGVTFYQSNGLTTMLDHNGNQYDFYTHPSLGSGYLKQVLRTATYANGTKVSITYTSSGRPRLVESSAGYALIFEYGGQNVSTVCGFNTAVTYVDINASCAASQLKTSYTYDSTGTRLASVTDTRGGITTFTYGDGGASNAQLLNCISLVNSATCAIRNSFGDQPGDGVIGGTNILCCTEPDQTRVQTTATGQIWRYLYNPPEDPSDYQTPPCFPRWSSAEMTDAGARFTGLTYDRGYLVTTDAPEGTTEYRYPNQCYSGILGTRPVQVEARLPRPALVRSPGGRRDYYEYDLRGNLVRHAVFPTNVPDPLLENGSNWIPTDPDVSRCCLALGKPAIPAGSLVYRQTYLPSYGGVGMFGQMYALGCGVGPSDSKRCNKPTSMTDANGNVTDFSYDPGHGGVLTETGAAVAGVRPQTRYTYVQRQAWLQSSAGGYAPTGQNIWLLASKSLCKTGMASGAGCAMAGDEVRTTYDYGPDSGPNNLLLRGTIEDAAGAALRTCYGYDWQGNKVSQTTPRAGLAVCP